MAYATIAQLQSHIQELTFSGSSKPTTTEVNNWLDEVSDEMDVKMRAAGVTVPVTTPANAMHYLERIVIAGVLARVFSSIQMESEEAAVRRLEFDAEMDRIVNNPALVRADTVRESVAGFNETAAGARTVIFKRYTDQW